MLKELAEADRLELLMRTPFFGRIIFCTEIVWVKDPKVKLSCNDCRRIFLSAETYPKLKPQKRLAVLAHEVLHIALRHAFRLGIRDPKRFGIAADIEVYFLLKETFTVTPPIEVNAAWEALTAEDIYDLLPNELPANAATEHCYENLQKTSGKNGENDEDSEDECSSENDNGNSDCDSRDDESENDANEEDWDGENDASSGDGNTSGDTDEDRPAEGDDDGCTDGKSGDGAESCDSKGKDGDAKENEESENTEGKSTNNPEESEISDFKPQFDEESEMFCRQTVITAQWCKQLGDIPGNLKQAIAKLDKPNINWKVLLRQFLRECRGGNYCWVPPNRRFVAKGLYLPGRRAKELKTVVVLDTSGSTVEQMPKFVAELTGLLNSFGKYHLTVIECDCKIQNVFEITSEKPVDLSKHKFRGGGGTSFIPALEYITKKIRTPQVVIFFTDGYGECTKFRPPYPVVWMLTDNGTVPVSWGTVIKYKGVN